MADRSVTVPCTTCGGSGHVPLVPSLQQALDALRKGSRTPSELAVMVGAPSKTAMNNRLEKLRALGLVTRERSVTRGYVYMAVDR